MDFVSEEQMVEFVRSLSLYYSDGSDTGLRMLEEPVRPMINSMDGSSYKEDLINKICKVYDGDDINVVEFKEFLIEMAVNMKKTDAEEELREVFKVFDRDQDGYISANELRNVMVSMGEKLTEEEAEQMINEADSDGDGRVNYQDFIQMMAKI